MDINVKTVPLFTQKQSVLLLMRCFLQSDKVLGMVEVNIIVSDEWVDIELSEHPCQDYFTDMSPVFCTSDAVVKGIRDDVNEHIISLQQTSKNTRRWDESKKYAISKVACDS